MNLPQIYCQLNLKIQYLKKRGSNCFMELQGEKEALCMYAKMQTEEFFKLNWMDHTLNFMCPNQNGIRQELPFMAIMLSLWKPAMTVGILGQELLNENYQGS